VKDLKQPITVEPLKGFRVIKDLVVDMEPFFAKYRAVMPYLINDEPPPPTERLQSPEERELFDDTRPSTGYRFWLSMAAYSLAGQLSTALTLALVASMSRRQFWNSGKPS
jgi:hypothetical protein